jgi:hypothetical protein
MKLWPNFHEHSTTRAFDHFL